MSPDSDFSVPEDIFKPRAYLKGSEEVIPSLRWQEGIEPKDV